MKTLRKLKLNALSEANLEDKEMNALRGGNCCGCSCYWEGKGGSSIEDNSSANYKLDTDSKDGCNQYAECDNTDNNYWDVEHA